jgi:hypothetical protein
MTSAPDNDVPPWRLFLETGKITHEGEDYGAFGTGNLLWDPGAKANHVCAAFGAVDLADQCSHWDEFCVEDFMDSVEESDGCDCSRVRVCAFIEESDEGVSVLYALDHSRSRCEGRRSEQWTEVEAAAKRYDAWLGAQPELETDA